MRITLQLTQELYAWLTEQAGTDSSDEKARRIAIRRWFYETAGVEAPARVFQGYAKSWNLDGPALRFQLDLTDEASLKIFELAGVDPTADSPTRNHSVLAWLSKKAGLPAPLTRSERSRERHLELKRKAQAFDALHNPQEAPDGSEA